MFHFLIFFFHSRIIFHNTLEKNHVLFGPHEFNNAGVSEYVRAMQNSHQVNSAIVIDDVVKAVESKLASDVRIFDLVDSGKGESRSDGAAEKFAKSIAEEAKNDVINQHYIKVLLRDSRDLNKNSVLVRIDEGKGFQNFLDNVFFCILSSGVKIPAFTYGKRWALKNCKDNSVIKKETPPGCSDSRSLREVGLSPGGEVEVVFL